MAQAQRDIEAKLVPTGPKVVRHLALPKTRRDIKWILSEMDTMDVEGGGNTDWRHGKLSGAVYHGGEDLEVTSYSCIHDLGPLILSPTLF